MGMWPKEQVEIYPSGPRKVAPERPKAVIFHPFKPIERNEAPQRTLRSCSCG